MSQSIAVDTGLLPICRKRNNPADGIFGTMLLTRNKFCAIIIMCKNVFIYRLAAPPGERGPNLVPDGGGKGVVAEVTTATCVEFLESQPKRPRDRGHKVMSQSLIVLEHVCPPILCGRPLRSSDDWRCRGRFPPSETYDTYMFGLKMCPIQLQDPIE
jgi:hypothetical protein